MVNEVHSPKSGHGLAGQVVLSGAKSATNDHKAGPGRRQAETRQVDLLIVGNGAVPSGVDPDFGQFSAKPLAVGVQIRPGGEFTPDRKDFRFTVGRGRLSGHVCWGLGPFSLKSGWKNTPAAPDQIPRSKPGPQRLH